MDTTTAVSHGASNPRARDDAFQIRRAVFMDEQGYENEFEAIDDDAACVHVVLYTDSTATACARVFPEALARMLDPETPQAPSCALDDAAGPGETYLLGRVAVMPAHRRHGLARQIIGAAEEAALKAGARLIKLHAQEYIRKLYADLGYQQIRDVDYEDEGQPHLWMAKLL